MRILRKAQRICAFNAELWFHPHWYRADNYWGFYPFTRFYKFNKRIDYDPEQLVETPHCSTFPNIYIELPSIVLAKDKYQMMHLGYLDMDRIKKRYYRMADCYEKGKWNTFSYLNWVRTLDGEGCTLKHVPQSHIDCVSHIVPSQGEPCSCKPPEIPRWLISPEEPGWKYIKLFGSREYRSKYEHGFYNKEGNPSQAWRPF